MKALLLLALPAFAGPGIPWKPQEGATLLTLPGPSAWRMPAPAGFDFAEGLDFIERKQNMGYAHWLKGWEDQTGRPHREHLYFFNFEWDYPTGELRPATAIGTGRVPIPRMIAGSPAGIVEGKIAGYPTIRFWSPAKPLAGWERSRIHFFRAALLGDLKGFRRGREFSTRWHTLVLVYWHEWKVSDGLPPAETEPSHSNFIRAAATLAPRADKE